MNKSSFRKAADGGNLVVISAAIGVLVLIGVYFLSQSLMKDNATVSKNINNALVQGTAELTR